MARVAEIESQRPTTEWATDLAPWDRLIESGRSLWGERWGFNYLANVAAGIRSTTEKCSDCPELFDASRSLARRVRYARLRSGAHKWWNNQIENSKADSQLLFTLMVVLTWSKTGTLLLIQDALNAAVNQLRQGEWEQLMRAVRTTSTLALVPEERGVNCAHSDLSETLGQRAATIFGRRADPDSRRQIYRCYFNSATLKDSVVREFAQQEALDVERYGTEQWQPDLKLVRKCYELGETVEPHAFYQAAYHRRETDSMPINVAREIAGSPEKYPGFLVAAAEERCRIDVSSRITPVADIAARDHWFSA